MQRGIGGRISSAGWIIHSISINNTLPLPFILAKKNHQLKPLCPKQKQAAGRGESEFYRKMLFINKTRYPSIPLRINHRGWNEKNVDS